MKILGDDKRESAAVEVGQWQGKRIKHMNTRPLEMITDTQPIGPIETDTDKLQEIGFSEDEIISLLWLQQWYQHGGSDRIEVLRNLEFLKFQIMNGRIER